MLTRRCSSADRIAASTIARLSTLLCTSPDGGWVPVRTAAMNSASEPSICSGPSPAAAWTGPPSAYSATGALSPSQRAVPADPLTRQLPFQEVSRPGLHQLPEKVNRASLANSKKTWSAASPRNQLQLGLNESQYTATGSEPVSCRDRSNWWMAMSTSSG